MHFAIKSAILRTVGQLTTILLTSLVEILDGKILGDDKRKNLFYSKEIFCLRSLKRPFCSVELVTARK